MSEDDKNQLEELVRRGRRNDRLIKYIVIGLIILGILVLMAKTPADNSSDPTYCGSHPDDTSQC